MKKKILLIMSMIILMFNLTACIQKQVDEIPINVNINMSPVAEHDDSLLILEDATVEKFDGELKVKAIYTNNKEIYVSVSDAFSVYAIQGEHQLNSVFDIRGKRNLKKKIGPGNSIEVEFVYKLENSDDVVVYACTPDAQKYIVGSITCKIEDLYSKND